VAEDGDLLLLHSRYVVELVGSRCWEKVKIGKVKMKNGT